MSFALASNQLKDASAPSHQGDRAQLGRRPHRLTRPICQDCPFGWVRLGGRTIQQPRLGGYNPQVSREENVKLSRVSLPSSSRHIIA